MLDQVLKHLEALVSFDTRNPPRDIGTGGIFDYLRAQLAGFRVEVTDHGAGAVSMLAVRGQSDAVVQRPPGYGAVVGGMVGESAEAAPHRRSRDRPGRV
jgi:acetylornithine deacetylase/succinyl-diaminopimelate desuccinylase-like protein